MQSAQAAAAEEDGGVQGLCRGLAGGGGGGEGKRRGRGDSRDHPSPPSLPVSPRTRLMVELFTT